MLANSNLSVITPKSNVNSSSAGSEPSTSTDSFDSVFQQVSGELSTDSPSQTVPPSGNSIKEDSVETDVLVGDEANLDESKELVSDSTPVEASVGAGLVAIEQDNISNLTAEGSSVQGSSIQGASTNISQEDIVNTELVSAQTDLALEGRGSLSDNDMPDSLDPKSLDASLVSNEGVASGTFNSINSAHNVSVEHELGKDGLIENTQPPSSVLAGQGEKSNLGGNSLQSQGVKVANQGEIQLNSVEENKLVNNQNAELTTNTLVSGSLAATAGLAKSDTNPTHDLTSSVEGHVEANSKVANASTSLATGLAASAATTNLASSSKATTSDSEVSGLLNEQLENLAKSDANKATQSLVPESDSLDVSAGLALLGVGALSRDTKSQVVAESAKSITPSSGLVSSELAENADLDWIMQQMPREQQVTAELGMGAELIKSTAPVSPALAQNTDQMTKVAAPLSLGLAAGESGLLEAGPESEMLIETEFKNNNANKIEPELGRQLDTSSSTRSGLGDSSLGTNTISTAPTAAVETKLGLATAVTNTSNPANMTMQVPPNHPNWSSEMGEKMMWMNRQGIQQAEIHLDPPELGSLTVKVSVDSDVATVSFVAASTQVKDLLEGQVQRLREMMAQQGVELAEVDVNVSQQGSGSQQSGEDADNQFAQHDLDTDSEEVDSSLMMNEANVSRSKVDFYA
ncbi:hypothetical protein OA92_18315 [Marinomonas sp. SBI22]|uniref:flagellar hook-length control protein FliK n=1 Tax=unclassified Marinomonas TaxID=196814 RepID=UPI0007AEEF23|nr:MULTISPECIES: flagellar hook-length control protein FliK [unclassified Marinomonas]KZM40015.1 hypothetical protein OA92_18315 [Marinomonas sp. SBI22]KZM41309.1 hypothetical protein OA91_17550 [Marinomonas sp. SBI8L]